MMIDAFDTAQGVRYNTFDPTVGSEQGLGFMGRTRPLSLLSLKLAKPTLMLKNPFTTGLNVGVLQALLNRNGAKLVVDGIFGPLTEAAVKIFQKSHLIPADGIVGPLTWSKL
jgi:peptidoglycan hydrolase-like protein with peptidoglycan-binding domain